MKKNINEELAMLKKKKRELKSLNKSLKYIEYETKYVGEELRQKAIMAQNDYDYYRDKMAVRINDCKEEVGYLEKEIETLKSSKVSIRVGDLLDELSRLSGISRDNIMIRLETNCWVRDFVERIPYTLNNVDYYRLFVTIEGREKNKKFRYFVHMPLDNNLLYEANGELGKHCFLKYEIEYGDRFTRVVLSKDVDDIVLDLGLYCLDTEECKGWYPPKLINRAIINVCKKENNSKSRVRSIFNFKKRG